MGAEPVPVVMEAATVSGVAANTVLTSWTSAGPHTRRR